MKRHLVSALLMSAAAVSLAQTTPTPAAKPVAHPAGTAATGSKAATPASPLVAPIIKAPANIPQHKGILSKTIFTVALRYQEIEVGTGPVAESGKLFKIFYTGWRAADGVKFDSTDDHPRPPLRDKDGKPVMGDDGKPKLGDPQPMQFVQGIGGTVPGFDQGVAGMKIGGKRRIFIPWQLAYGARAIPDRGPDHPGIPAKSDLIFDVMLAGVSEPPPPAPARMPMNMNGGRPMPGSPGAPGRSPAAPGQPGAPATPGQPAAPASPATPGSANPSAAPAAAPANPPAGSAPTTPTTTPQPK